MGQLVSDVKDVLNHNQSKKEAASTRKAILEQIAADEKAKSNLVKKTLAAQRAKYGSAGMTNKGTTEEAVLKRLREETEEPYNEKKKNNLNKLSKVKSTKSNLLKSLMSDLGDMFVG